MKPLTPRDTPVALTSPGPVLFRQERVGLDGRVFNMLKFRTMRVEPNAVENDIENWSPWPDLKILLLTPGAVLGGRDAE